MVDLGLHSGIPVQTINGIISMKTCTKKQWSLLTANNPNYIYLADILIDDISAITNFELPIIFDVYIKTLLEIREKLNLTIPQYIVKDTDDCVKYTVITSEEKLVADYANISIFDVDNIRILEYWLLKRDAFISLLSKSKEGREYLNNAYRLEQVDADEDFGGL